MKKLMIAMTAVASFALVAKSATPLCEDEDFNDRYIMSLPVLMTDGNWIQPIVIEAVECQSSYGWNKEITAQVQCGACGNVGNIPDEVRLKLAKIYKNAAIAVMAILNDLDKTLTENGQES